MRIALALEQTDPHGPTADERASSGPGQILSRIFALFDSAGVRYCVLHGYQDYPRRIKSDVDCVIDAVVSPRQLLALLRRNSARIGAEVVHCRGYNMVLAGRNPDASPCFLTLDISTECGLDGLTFYAGQDVLASRRRYRHLWIPSAGVAFGCYLARSIAKGSLDEARTRRLSDLYRRGAAGCERQLARFWGPGSAAIILAAAQTGNWRPVRAQLNGLRAELAKSAALRFPGRFLGHWLHKQWDRMRRLCRPDGLYLVVLGPDGAGKSTVIDELGPRLASVFPRFSSYGFAPELILRMVHGRVRPSERPHGLPPRSILHSVARAVLYWGGYYTFGYLVRHLDLARSMLVLGDRHFVDVLVDQRRYRYGGPLWLIRLIWRLIPKPDLIVLLDAPAELVQARKQEVSIEETARQRMAYLSLMRTLRNGHVVDAAQPLTRVVDDVSDIVLRQLKTRTALRFGLRENAAARPQPDIAGGPVLPLAKQP